MDIDLIELRSLKPLDMATIRASVEKTHKVVILDESTMSGGVGATISAMISEKCFDLLDAPVSRQCMDDAPVCARLKSLISCSTSYPHRRLLRCHTLLPWRKQSSSVAQTWSRPFTILSANAFK